MQDDNLNNQNIEIEKSWSEKFFNVKILIIFIVITILIIGLFIVYGFFSSKDDSKSNKINIKINNETNNLKDDELLKKAQEEMNPGICEEIKDLNKKEECQMNVIVPMPEGDFENGF